MGVTIYGNRKSGNNQNANTNGSSYSGGGYYGGGGGGGGSAGYASQAHEADHAREADHAKRTDLAEEAKKAWSAATLDEDSPIWEELKEMFLSRLNDDTANGLIAFLKGINVGKLFRFDANGNIIAHSIYSAYPTNPVDGRVPC